MLVWTVVQGPAWTAVHAGANLSILKVKELNKNNIEYS